MVLIAITLACIAASFLVFQSNGKHEAASNKKSQRCGSIKNPYRAASIGAGGCACAEAKSLENKRFLIQQTPGMPLRECDAKKCDCRYVRHDDRRVGEDRRAAFSLQTDLYEMAGRSKNRVTGYSRRRSDSSCFAAASDFQYKNIKWAH
jgi:hypothetical protein